MLKAFLCLFLTLSSSHLAFAAGNSIQIKGSDTMVNLAQAWAEVFMAKNKDAYIAVTGGGSGTGISALLSNTCDIAISSRSIKKEEIAKAQSAGIQPLEKTVGLDGLAVVVNIHNPVNQLTIDQVADIFTGRVKNWKDVGGEDRPIVILSREVNSGTHVYFKEHVLRKGDSKSKIEFAPQSLLMPSSQAIADEIAQNPNAIGYYGMGYVNPTQKKIAIAKDKSSGYYSPVMENVRSGKYYISRPLYFYTNGEASGLLKEVIDFFFIH
jgi:phosphate transport system substrate-binding protein